MIIDSHCHLDYEPLNSNLEKVLIRASGVGVKYFLTICTKEESFEKILIILKKYKNIFGTYGIHPHETKNHTQIDRNLIVEKKNGHKKIIGIGETGLDYYYDHSDHNVQKKSFEEHIYAAADLNIPVIVHSRSADTDTYEILKDTKKKSDLKILMHCFTGSKTFARKLIELGCYISISGIITFKNSNDLLDTVSFIPNENLLVETDSPYLAPIPYRGKSNEPSYIVHTIDKIAQIKKIPKNDLAKYTTNNFYKLFNFK